MYVQSQKYFWPGWSLTYKLVHSAEPNKNFWTMFWKHLKSNSRAFFLWNPVFHLEGIRVPHSVVLCHLKSNAVLCPDASQKRQSQVSSGKRTRFSQTCPLGGHLLGWFFLTRDTVLPTCWPCCWSVVQLCSDCCLMTLFYLLKQDGDFPAPATIYLASCL